MSGVGEIKIMEKIKELLPIGSVVLMRGGTKKIMIIGILQVSEEEKDEVYDYIGVPYPEGYMGADNVFLFQHENINDVIFKGYDNPERQEFIKLMDEVLEKTREQVE